MTAIAVSGLTKRFGATTALSDVSLDFAPGSFTALLGPSGCGKTTLLRLIAGFEVPDEGSVSIGGELVADAARQVPPERRGVGVVFQSYALWPHLDVAGNVAYPLKARGVPRGEIGRRVADVLSTVGLSGFGERRIEALSGGQRQRVALARCLVADSRVILFDEPLANLDMHLRAAMTESFREIHGRTGATMVYVTHDQTEALALADRVVVMEAGRILQAAAPAEVYHSPSGAAVAGFVGRGFLLRGTAVAADRGTVRVAVAGAEIEARAAASRLGACTLLLRPEALRLGELGLPARVVGSIYRGPVHELLLETPDGERLAVDSVAPVPVGTAVHVAVSDAWLIPER